MDLEDFIDDLASITAHGGGDFPEFGVRAIERAFDASIQIADPINNVYSHILVFTDAPAKDYADLNNVYAKVLSSDVIVHSSLPDSLLTSSPMCGSYSSSSYLSCIQGSVRGYADLAGNTGGIVVDSLTCSTALDYFIQEYNFLTGSALRPLSCNVETCKKRRAIISGPPSNSTDPAQHFYISDIAARVRLLISPGARFSSISITVTNPLGTVVRTQTISDIAFISFEGSSLIPGVWTVSGSANFSLDVSVENGFDFSVDFLNETTSEPIDSLPPPGCALYLPILVFTRQLDRLHSTYTQYIHVVTSNGTVLQRSPLTRCDSYFRGRILVPGVSFYLQFSGITKSGHSFSSTVYNKVVPTPVSCDVDTISAPSTIFAGETAEYVFRLTTDSPWPSCPVTIPINVAANTTADNVTLSVIPSEVNLTSSSPATIRVRARAAGTSDSRGELQLLFTGDDGEVLCSTSATIEVEVSDLEQLHTCMCRFACYIDAI